MLIIYQVFKLIDSAKQNPAFAKKFLDSGEVHLNVIFPHGVLLNDLMKLRGSRQNKMMCFQK